jgi:2,3-bisphosphoglycerate-independent phosphoglycerate mutase
MNTSIPTLLLLILDGWGTGKATEDNAILHAETPQWDQWIAEGSYTTLCASGKSVGLPDNQMGNSEVGHMHIGAGRVIKQDLTQISDDIATGTFQTQPELLAALNKYKATPERAIHLIGLLSDGGVHSHESHVYALLDAIKALQLDNTIYIHAFLDGRDTPPNSARASIERLQQVLQEHPTAKLASLCGRYFAMDRDNRWERVEQAYDLLTMPQQQHQNSAEAFLSQCYEQQLFDEFIPPTALIEHQAIQNSDLVIFFNFRADRARELSRALTQQNFEGFTRKTQVAIELLTMTQYEADLAATVIYPPRLPQHTLGECVEQAGMAQLRIAETEKYAHVTFFLNGGNEQPFNNEDRQLLPSPKVKTYDLQPEMRAPEVTEALCEAIRSEKYKLIVCNFANADMVGHTGNFPATVQAIEALDSCFIHINAALQATQSEMLITADHGNAEQMFDDHTQQPHTAHTNEDVPFVYVGSRQADFEQRTGNLIDIAPTVLSLMGLPIPAEMTGKCLLTIPD